MTKLNYILRLLLLLFCGHVFSQELPPIQNYSIIDYGGANQNWSISQSDNKIIYVANNYGLLEFDGAEWRLFPSPNGSDIRSVKVIDNLIYTGCYMEFGYWEKDKYGGLIYTSLLEKLKIPLEEDEQFWNILEFEGLVLFQSLQSIYVYNIIDGSISKINSISKRAEIFSLDKSIYFQKIDEGIFKIENGKSVMLTDDAIVQNNVLVGVFLSNNKLLFLTEQGEFYYLKDTGLERWNIPADSELASINVYSSLQLKDGSFMLGTISNGIYHLDQEGNLISIINQAKGLNNNTILSIFEDHNNNLWLGLDNGISVVNLKSPFKVFNDLNGKLGAVYTSIVHNDYLYLGTNQGLFYKKFNSSDNFSFIQNTDGQVWCLKNIDDVLFCGHNNGTYIIEGNIAKKVADLPGTWDVKKIVNEENLLLQGNYSGLSVLEKKEDQWQFRNRIDGFDIPSRFFEFMNDHQIIVNHEYKGILTLEIDRDFKKVLNVTTEEPKGYGASLVRYDNEVLYASNNGVFKFNDSNSLVIDSLLTNVFFGENERVIGTLISEKETNKLWGFTNDNIMYVTPGKIDKMPQEVKVPVPVSFRINVIPGFESLSHLESDSYLIGAVSGYTIINLDKVVSDEYSIEINSIIKEFLNKTDERISLSDITEFESYENSVNFSFSVPVYDKYIEVTYQYKLEGLYNNWGEWSSDSNVSFKNLSYGDYNFFVRAKIGNEISKNIATYNFKINRPWFQSNKAILIYTVSFFLILGLIHRGYIRYYNKQRIKLIEDNRKKLELTELGNEQELMKLRNDKLRQDIENKNSELAISTMSLIRKNELLRSIKKELVQIEKSPESISVIKIIDNNLNNNNDWEFFQEAFNNADKDFLKKIHQLHPSLTPNDLRFCAYLRLNLSSKEIAPLLNISFRSVEIKRYRLRKKMDLAHEKSLVEYILEV